MLNTLRKITQTVWFHVHQFQPSVIAAYAAGATLFIFISFFPFMLVLLSVIRLIPEALEYFTQARWDFVPAPIRQLLAALITDVSAQTPSGVLPVAVLTALWTSSSGFVSLARGLNIVYKTRETRPFLIVRLVCMVYTVVFIILILAVLIVLVFGNQLLNLLQNSFSSIEFTAVTGEQFRTFGAAIVLVLFFCIMYTFVPNRRSRLFFELPGAVFSAFGWSGFSKVYSLYISYATHRSAVYGSLSVIVLLMLWLYACIYIVFIGAQINNVIMLSRKRKTSYPNKTEG